MIQFTIPLRAQGKERPRVVNGHAYTPETTRAYEDAVRWAYLVSRQGFVSRWAPLRVEITAEFAAVTKAEKALGAELYGKPYTKKPDADNIAKAILDALNVHAYRDDAAVVSLVVRKIYGKQDRVVVIIEEYADEQQRM